MKGERHLAADGGLDALNRANVEFYRRGNDLVRVGLTPAKTADGEDILVPGILPITLPRLGRALGLAAHWEHFDARAKKWVPTDPPGAVAEQILSMSDEWPFAPLTGPITCPTLRPDGSLLTEPGYDKATGLYLTDASTLPPITERPTRDEAKKGLNLFLELLVEFPFADEASKSVAVSTLITPVLRMALGPVVPAHAASAPVPGTGKSYLHNLAAYIATGRPCAVVTADRKPEETDKRLIGTLLSGRTLIALDNTTGILESGLLCQAIEQPMLDLRPLGTSVMNEITNTVTVLINGNNLTVAQDLVRRTAICRLDADCEAPEERTYKTDPLGMVTRNRAAYIAAAITIGRAYIVADMPDVRAPLPSFANWSNRLRSALVWLGMEDPVETMTAARLDDPIHQERAEVFQAWGAALGENPYRTSELIAEAEKQTEPGTYDHLDLRDALRQIAPERGGGINARSLGKWLSKNVDMIAGGWKLRADHRDKLRPRWLMKKSP